MVVAIVLVEMVEERFFFFFFFCVFVDEEAVFGMPGLLAKSNFSNLNPNQPITKHKIGNF